MSLIEEARAVRERIAARLAELEPLVQEYEQLKEAAAQLGIDTSEAEAVSADVPSAPDFAAAAKPASAGAGAGAGAPAPKPKGTSSRRTTRRRTTRPPRTPAATRQSPEDAEGSELGERVLRAVQEQPGQTVADYARALDVAATVLYRPVRDLTTSGQIVKRNRQLYPN